MGFTSKLQKVHEETVSTDKEEATQILLRPAITSIAPQLSDMVLEGMVLLAADHLQSKAAAVALGLSS